jgi:hypothetical protein
VIGFKQIEFFDYTGSGVQRPESHYCVAELGCWIGEMMPRRTIVYYRFTSKLGEGSMGAVRRA